jgi:hypothetical protein
VRRISSSSRGRDRQPAYWVTRVQRRPLEHFLEVEHRLGEEPGDRASLRVAQTAAGRQGVDVLAVADVRRDAAGRGVRVREVPELLQGRHLVSDRGGGDAEARALGDRLASDGLAGVDVLVDDRAQDRDLPGTELGLHDHGVWQSTPESASDFGGPDNRSDRRRVLRSEDGCGSTRWRSRSSCIRAIPGSWPRSRSRAGAVPRPRTRCRRRCSGPGCARRRARRSSPSTRG